MAMSDEAMFAPPQGITIEAVNGMLAERLAQKHGKASLLRAFIPLPPPFSPVTACSQKQLLLPLP